MIEQVTVFLENAKGRLAALTRVLANAHVNMEALTIAETSDYGLVRIICDKPAQAVAALEEAGFRAITTKVIAVAVPNKPGGLADLLETLDTLNLNIEYGYCFSSENGRAVDVLKVGDPARAVEAIQSAGFELES